MHSEGRNKRPLTVRPEFYLQGVDSKFRITMKKAVGQKLDSSSGLRHSSSQRRDHSYVHLQKLPLAKGNCFAHIYISS